MIGRALLLKLTKFGHTNSLGIDKKTELMWVGFHPLRVRYKSVGFYYINN